MWVGEEMTEISNIKIAFAAFLIAGLYFYGVIMTVKFIQIKRKLEPFISNKVSQNPNCEEK